MIYKKTGDKYTLSDSFIFEDLDYESVKNFINNQIEKHKIEIDKLKWQLSNLEKLK